MQIASPVSIDRKTAEHLLVFSRDIDINSIHSKTLNYITNLSASNTVPLFIRIFRKKGIISQASFSIKLDEIVLKHVSEQINSLIGTTNRQLILQFDSIKDSIVYPTSGNYSVEINSINGSAATIDIEIYGLKL